MKRIGMRTKFMLIFIALFTICAVILVSSVFKNGASWSMHPANQDLFTDGVLKYESEISDRHGALLLKTSDGALIYNDSEAIRRSTLHAVGEASGNIVSGVYTSNRSRLTGYNPVFGAFSLNGRGSDMTLTLDAGLCASAYGALDGRKGTIGVYNYKTGEILCMISSPNYDPNDPPAFGDEIPPEYEGIYLNRLLTGLYAPGSVFKIITSMAAIETIPDIYERTFLCEGGTYIDGEWIACMGNHGNIGFESAFSHSCNAAYAVIANELGSETLEQYAKKAGFGETFEVNGVKTSASRIDLEGISNANLGWAGIGQFTDLANPYNFMLLAGAVANGGQPVKPYLISKSGLMPEIRLNKHEKRLADEDTAEALKAMMRNNVIEYYGDGTFEGLHMCAKTGTAEVDDGEPHAWFTGFLDDETHPYAFVVVVEHGGSGLSVAGSVANTVMQAAVGG